MHDAFFYSTRLCKVSLLLNNVSLVDMISELIVCGYTACFFPFRPRAQVLAGVDTLNRRK